MTININNIFQFCNNSIDCNNILFSLGEEIGNSIMLLGIKNDNNHIYTYSNEWLYLIKAYYPNNPYYPNLVEFYHKIINNKNNITRINENVISLISSFSRGTVHGYTGFYNSLLEYLNNYDKHKNKKILVYKNTQKGMLDILNHLCNKKIIDKNKIIYIEKNKVYHFESITFIPNKYHIFTDELSNKVSNLIKKYIIIDKSDKLYYKSLNLPSNLNKICIIKGSNTPNLTSDGIVPIEHIKNFTKKWDITLIEPGLLDEVKLVHCIYQCKLLIMTWGTAFLKNYIYISDICEKIIVLIIGDVFLQQYNSASHHKTLKLKYKNATIKYKIVDFHLNFDVNNI